MCCDWFRPEILRGNKDAQKFTQKKFSIHSYVPRGLSSRKMFVVWRKNFEWLIKYTEVIVPKKKNPSWLRALQLELFNVWLFMEYKFLFCFFSVTNCQNMAFCEIFLKIMGWLLDRDITMISQGTSGSAFTRGLWGMKQNLHSAQ